MIRENIKDKITVGVIGFGRNGYAINAKMALAGYSSVAFSLKPSSVEMTNNGHNFEDVPNIPKNLVYLTFTDMLHATTDPAVAIRRYVVFCLISEFADEIGEKKDKATVELAEMIGVYAHPGSVFVFLTDGEVSQSESELKKIILEKSFILSEETVEVKLFDENSAVQAEPDKFLANIVGISRREKTDE